MKKVIYLLTVLAITVAFVSCGKSDNQILDDATQDAASNIELRASNLGFSGVADYQAYVAAQHAAGNHENCCLLPDGTHQICTHPNHEGTCCNGTHYNGTGHGTYNGTQHNCNNPNCTGFVDVNGDGICDNCNNSNPNCTGFVDANGDGICDNCNNPNCTGAGSQNGKGNHNGNHH